MAAEVFRFTVTPDNEMDWGGFLVDDLRIRCITEEFADKSGQNTFVQMDDDAVLIFRGAIQERTSDQSPTITDIRSVIKLEVGDEPYTEWLTNEEHGKALLRVRNIGETAIKPIDN